MEACTIVFEALIPEQRPADGHDVAGKLDLVIDRELRASVPRDAAALMRSCGSSTSGSRWGAAEGAVRDVQGAGEPRGNTEIVAPLLVEGTLERGWDRYEYLPAGLARAVFAMFLVAEVHPLVDCNGRVARALANAELTAAG